MKKILALTLAAVMAAGMTTVAFAAPDNENVVIQFASSDNYYVIYDGANGKDKDGKLEAEEYTTENELDTLSGGTVLYFPLWDQTDNYYLTNEDDRDGWRLYTDWTVGDADKAEFDTIKFGSKRIEVIKVTLPEAIEDKAEDLVGTIKLYGTGSGFSKDDATTNNARQITFSVTYGFDAVDFDTAEDKGFENAKLVKFEDRNGDDIDDVVEMEFGDYMLFEVDVTGQGKLNLKNNQDFDPEFAAYYDYANIDFINFEYEPTFNKIGRVYIYADEDAFIYKKGAEGAEKINGLEWDEDYEAWTFKTRKLESYVISDVELDEKTVTEDNSSSATEDGGKDNPDTGR